MPWLTRSRSGAPFDEDATAINELFRNIYSQLKLHWSAPIRQSRTARPENHRSVSGDMDHHPLKLPTRQRQWADPFGKAKGTMSNHIFEDGNLHPKAALPPFRRTSAHPTHTNVSADFIHSSKVATGSFGWSFAVSSSTRSWTAHSWRLSCGSSKPTRTLASRTVSRVVVQGSTVLDCVTAQSDHPFQLAQLTPGHGPEFPWMRRPRRVDDQFPIRGRKSSKLLGQRTEVIGNGNTFSHSGYRVAFNLRPSEANA